MNLEGKGCFLYVVSYVEGSNPNVIPSVAERQAHAVRLAEAAKSAGLSHVLIKVADGIYPYNRRRKNPVTGEIIFNSTLADATDDCILVTKELQNRNIKVYGWQFVYSRFPTKEAEMAIQRMRELDLDGWVVNAEYAHKTIINGVEAWSPPQTMIAKVGEYMAAVRAETLRLKIPLGLSSYKFPSSHPSFPFSAFLEYCDFNMPQVYPVGDPRPDAHSIQLEKSIREYMAINPDIKQIPTGGAYSQGYQVRGVTYSWVATPEQVTDFFAACERMGIEAANVWEWYAAAVRFPPLWNALAEYPWPGEIILPPAGEGDPLPWRPRPILYRTINLQGRRFPRPR